MRNPLFLAGLPVAVVLANQAFDRDILNARKTQAIAQKNIAIDRLDKLQDINAEICRRHSDGKARAAIALIEAGGGQIVRVSDAVDSAWSDQSGMLGRYDLRALSEALLVQGRTDDPLDVVRTVEVSDFGATDPMLLVVRILF